MEDGRRTLALTTWQRFVWGSTPFQSKFPKFINENGEVTVLLLRPGGLKEAFNLAREEASSTSRVFPIFGGVSFKPRNSGFQCWEIV